jgi:hypothetical protein
VYKVKLLTGLGLVLLNRGVVELATIEHKCFLPPYRCFNCTKICCSECSKFRKAGTCYYPEYKADGDLFWIYCDACHGKLLPGEPRRPAAKLCEAEALP